MSRRLKILFLASWFPHREGPYFAPFVREHARAVALYHDVTVLGPPIRDDQLPGWIGLREETDPELTAGVPTFQPLWRPAPVPRWGYRTHDFSIRTGFRKICRNGFRPDLIHLHIFELGDLAWQFARQLNVPLVVSEHTTLFPEKRFSPAELALAKRTFEAAAVVLPDARTLGEAIQACGIGGRYQFVPNVADPQWFYPPTERPRRDHCLFLFVGRIGPNHVKGMPELIEALHRLHARRQDWRLRVIGGGPTQPDCEQRLTELGLRDRVEFLGGQPPAVIGQHMREADWFVLPSRAENFPCVLVEALMCGLPAVATAVGDVPQMLDATNGIVVPPRDPVSLADALSQAMQRRAEFDRAAIARAAQQYAPAAVGATLDAIYRAALEQHHAG